MVLVNSFNGLSLILVYKNTSTEFVSSSWRNYINYEITLMSEECYHYFCNTNKTMKTRILYTCLATLCKILYISLKKYLTNDQYVCTIIFGLQNSLSREMQSKWHSPSLQLWLGLQKTCLSRKITARVSHHLKAPFHNLYFTV